MPSLIRNTALMPSYIFLNFISWHMRCFGAELPIMKLRPRIECIYLQLLEDIGEAVNRVKRNHPEGLHMPLVLVINDQSEHG